MDIEASFIFHPPILPFIYVMKVWVKLIFPPRNLVEGWQSQAGKSYSSHYVDSFGHFQSRYIGSQELWERNNIWHREAREPQDGD